MMGFTGGASTIQRWVQQIPQPLIREERPGSKDDLGGSESEGGGSSGLLRLQLRDERVCPVIAGDLLAESPIEGLQETVRVARWEVGDTSQVLLENGL